MARQRRNLVNSLPTRRTFVAPPRQVKQVGRNEPCPCGSGKKYKNCHAGAGEAYLHKVAEDEARRARESAREGKRPWYLRLFGG
jgi:hypothetical protein